MRGFPEDDDLQKSIAYYTRLDSPHSSSRPLRESLSASLIHSLSSSGGISTDSTSEYLFELRRNDPTAYNTAFQELLELTTIQEREKFIALAQLASTFISDATALGRIIISEQNLPTAQQLIRPNSLPGIAGGPKYVAHSILFKFCQDVIIPPGIWMYGNDKRNDDLAITASGRELVGLNAIFSCYIPELHFPLMASIDFRGYRLLAMSLLPVERTTIKYGSDDWEKICNDSPEINELMKKVGTCLNLREHLVQDQKLVACGDIEVHESKKDNRYYVIDFQRLMPPEAPESQPPRSVFYNFLRPELVKTNPTPLCSDTFTLFLSINDPNFNEMTEDVKKATRRLHNEVIEDFVQAIVDNSKYLGEKIVLYDDYSLAYEIHRRGINLRHLGRIRSLLLNRSKSGSVYIKLFATYLLQEMSLRSIKTHLRRALRNVSSIADEPLKTTIRDILNIISMSSKHRRFWDVDVKEIIISKFGTISLKNSERCGDFSLDTCLNKEKLIIRLSAMCGFRLRAKTVDEFHKHMTSHVSGDDGGRSGDFEFNALDIEEIFPMVKYMSFLDYVSGVKELLVFRGLPFSEVMRLEKVQLETACVKLQNSLFRNPSDSLAWYHWAEVKLELLKRIWTETPLKLELEEIVAALENACLKWPDDNNSKILYIEAQIVRSIFWDQPIPSSVDVVSIIKSVNDEQLLRNWILRNFWTMWKVSSQIFPEIFKLVLNISEFLSESGFFCGTFIKFLLPKLSNIDQWLQSQDNLTVSEFVLQYACDDFPFKNSKSLLPSHEDYLSQCVLALLKANFQPRKISGIKQYCWEWKSKRQWISYDAPTTKILESIFLTNQKQFQLAHQEGLMNPLFAQQGYVVDLEKMTQTNVVTNYERPVRRVVRLDDLDFVVWILGLWSCLKFLEEVVVERKEEVWEKMLRDVREMVVNHGVNNEKNK